MLGARERYIQWENVRGSNGIWAGCSDANAGTGQRLCSLVLQGWSFTGDAPDFVEVGEAGIDQGCADRFHGRNDTGASARDEGSPPGQPRQHGSEWQRAPGVQDRLT